MALTEDNNVVFYIFNLLLINHVSKIDGTNESIFHMLYIKLQKVLLT